MKKRSPEAFFDLAEANGLGKLEETVISGDLVLRDLAAGTEKNYSYILGPWDKSVLQSYLCAESLTEQCFSQIREAKPRCESLRPQDRQTLPP
jgi:hypothetical protein